VIDPFVDSRWLFAHLDQVVVADVRYYLDGRLGRDAYADGHIPGAVFVDVDRDLSKRADASHGRHPLPTPDGFAASMARLGLGDEDTVIAYDDAGGIMAARLVWMLRVTCHAAALLDGGLDAWDGPLEMTDTFRAPAEFAAQPWPVERLASIDDAARAADEDIALLDARQRDRFAGAPDHLDPRAGHIPGARNVPVREHLGADGRLKPVAELREAFAAAGVGGGGDVISSCGSGVTACHNLLVMEHAGLGVHRLFPGSWSQWSRDESRPAATG
jgi:thiosulfate/3-mercaptopyruvate sulfurtransferase